MFHGNISSSIRTKIFENIEDLGTFEDFLNSNTVVDVYLVDNGDFSNYQIGFLGVEAFLILECNIKDPRGNIGALIPQIQDNSIIWGNQTRLTLKEFTLKIGQGKGTFDYIHNTSFIKEISKNELYQYLRWISSIWLKNNSIYSILQSNSTMSSFLNESIKFISPDNNRLCILPKLQLYYLEYSDRKVCSPSINDCVSFYKPFESISDPLDLRHLWNGNSNILLYENVGSGRGFWILHNAILKSVYLPIIDPKIMVKREVERIENPKKEDSEHISVKPSVFVNSQVNEVVTAQNTITLENSSDNTLSAGVLAILFVIIILFFILMFIVFYYLNNSINSIHTTTYSTVPTFTPNR